MAYAVLISHYWYLSLRSGRGAPQVTGTKGPLIKQVAGRPMARAHALLSSTYFPLIYVWKYKEPDSSPGPRKGLCSVCHRKSSKQTRRQAFRSSTLMTPNLGWHCWIGVTWRGHCAAPVWPKFRVVPTKPGINYIRVHETLQLLW